MKKPEILSIQLAAKSRLFEIQSVDLRFSNGELRTYERFKPTSRSAVMILAIDDQQNLLLTYEYAVGTEQYELGFPKGLMEIGETPEQSANRELQEEIGFAAKQFTLLRTLISSPGYMNNPMHILLAESLYPSRLEGDEPEALQLVRYPLDKIDELLDDPKFNEARNLSALFLLKKHLAQR
ncbi:ADP compounds hydrolase NudE [Gallibacterium genomosp. 3]|uniref:ADP-ribose diphosphatase n=1 Tax=Gallibacterium genomosp. 3 TaxID=505345 RepID=A0A1A7Q7H6_9PAST|nr:ADP compounds hydrolase NudE [Gallibacterium genomosp. 3]OBX10071.1 ADP-ribose diphosphatase [Gallibacterium genomosp. 3]